MKCSRAERARQRARPESGSLGLRRRLPMPTAAAVEAADRFYPAFDFLLKGSRSPEDAMAACMFETVGHA